jgi:hypothetical protein
MEILFHCSLRLINNRTKPPSLLPLIPTHDLVRRGPYLTSVVLALCTNSKRLPQAVIRQQQPASFRASSQHSPRSMRIYKVTNFRDPKILERHQRFETNASVALRADARLRPCQLGHVSHNAL